MGHFFIFGRTLQWGYTNKLRVRATLKFQKKGHNPRWPPKNVKDSKFVFLSEKLYFYCSKILLGSQQAQNFLVFENRSNRTDFIAVFVLAESSWWPSWITPLLLKFQNGPDPQFVCIPPLKVSAKNKKCPMILNNSIKF